ncbi:E2 domain-associated cysteine-rich protein [Azospirillum tabaci]|uniref:E2 domain-associated cysteine-rich protein n=1 Tax=Azospirillum tabaci TaxID=2752310 RepID=UPI001660BA4A|nr:E2 domain-associated cysteine-rich protein [Azospirillum tabaci]
MAGRQEFALFHRLRAQMYAERHRRWPSGAGRAHGEAAAPEAIAEAAAAAFGPAMLADLRAKRLTVRRIKLGAGRTGLRLMRNDGILFVLGSGRDRIVGLGRPCSCGAGWHGPRAIGKCGDHAKRAAELVLAMAAMEEAECAFVETVRAQGRTCCGRMDGCPLAPPAENCGKLRLATTRRKAA